MVEATSVPQVLSRVLTVNRQLKEIKLYSFSCLWNSLSFLSWVSPYKTQLFLNWKLLLHPCLHIILPLFGRELRLFLL